MDENGGRSENRIKLHYAATPLRADSDLSEAGGGGGTRTPERDSLTSENVMRDRTWTEAMLVSVEDAK